MSSREVVFTDHAELDLRAIIRYTRREWGEDQSTVYANRLSEEVQRIAQFPSIGAPRTDLGQEIRARAIDQHIVVYLPTDDTVLILRLLHKRMNATVAQLTQP